MSTDILHNTLLRADCEAILKLVLGEIDLRKGFLVLDLTNCFFDLFLSRRHGFAPSSMIFGKE